MTNVVVAGGAGYLGSILCEHLLNQGHEVICVDRFYFGHDSVAHLKTNPLFKTIQADTRSLKSEDFEAVEVVIDMAGISNDPACELDEALTRSVNYGGSIAVAESARAAGVKRLIYSSSCSVYGSSEDSEITELSEPHPVSLYAREKIRSEQSLLEMNSDDFSVTVLRNATAYGVSHRMRFDLIINIMTAYALSRDRIFVLGGGNQWRPLVHVSDIASAFTLVMDSPPEKVAGEIFNVGSNDQNHQVITVARMIKRILPQTVIDIVPDDPDKRSYNVNFDKLKSVLGFTAKVTVIDGINEVRGALESGIVSEEDIRTSTVKYYMYLIEAERVLDQIRLNGKVF